MVPTTIRKTIREAGLGEIQEPNKGHIEFSMSVRHLSADDIEWTIAYTNLEFRRGLC